ncbi:MAG: hypothetical protein PVJ53_03965, partial [Desulfobacterales bacterium]
MALRSSGLCLFFQHILAEAWKTPTGEKGQDLSPEVRVAEIPGGRRTAAGENRPLFLHLFPDRF